jgi:cytochrome c oxidase cbb3-type subunit 3
VDASLAEKGAARYATLCVACHGPEGKGNSMLGAPNLTNNIWLYGGDTESLTQTLVEGRNGKMPAFQNQLSEDRRRVLAAYVAGLSED